MKDRKHLDRVRLLPCCLTLWHRSDARNDAAHIRYQTGMARRPPDNHVLPLRHELHLYGEHRIGDFWPRAGFKWGTDNDPRAWAERLHEISGDWEAMEALVRDMAERANLLFIADVMRRVAA